ncbi:hypothetical protein Mapa_014396 [Marchantia paleacea]|nr:hypothetical protein Mapa_014396 [Marchantia paleacea]
MRCTQKGHLFPVSFRTTSAVIQKTSGKRKDSDPKTCGPRSYLFLIPTGFSIFIPQKC